MSFRFWISGFLCLILGMCATYAVGREPAGEPILGPAESIGSVLLFTSFEDLLMNDSQAVANLGVAEPIGRLLVFVLKGESDVIEAVVFESAPQLGRPELLASLIPEELDMPTEKPPLGTTLILTGFDELPEEGSLEEVVLGAAVPIGRMLSFDSTNDSELQLKMKEEQLGALQAEVDRIRRFVRKPIGRPDVLVSVRFIEIKREISPLLDPFYIGSVPEEKLNQSGVLTQMSSPPIRVKAGQTATVWSDGNSKADGVSQAGNPNFTGEMSGKSLIVTPEVVEGNRIRLSVRASCWETDPSNSVSLGGIVQAGFTRRRVQSTVEIDSGDWLVVSGLISGSKEYGIAVLAEIAPSGVPDPEAARSPLK